MQLTNFTDYALRTLLYLGAQPERLVPIAEVSAAYGISRHHLMKVASLLARAGFVAAVRGGGAAAFPSLGGWSASWGRAATDRERGPPSGMAVRAPV